MWFNVLQIWRKLVSFSSFLDQWWKLNSYKVTGYLSKQVTVTRQAHTLWGLCDCGPVSLLTSEYRSGYQRLGLDTWQCLPDSRLAWWRHVRQVISGHLLSAVHEKVSSESDQRSLGSRWATEATTKQSIVRETMNSDDCVRERRDFCGL
jgi:hypothetical protein